VKTRLILKAGRPGTKRLVAKYGDSLVCVRFKYDEESRQRLKTVELVVERSAWSPPPRYAADTLVPLRIEVTDMPMRLQAQAAGGWWNPKKKHWFVKYGKIAGTPLEKHIHFIDDSKKLE